MSVGASAESVSGGAGGTRGGPEPGDADEQVKPEVPLAADQELDLMTSPPGPGGTRRVGGSSPGGLPEQSSQLRGLAKLQNPVLPVRRERGPPVRLPAQFRRLPF